MPRFYARLEAPDGSGEFRFVSITAPSESEARAALERREQGFAAFRLDTEELADCEKQAADAAKEGKLAHPDVRQKLVLHHQAAPYELVYFGDSERPPRAVTKEGGDA
jgi:hypothetical protein